MFGHPVHVMLIHFPIALYPLSLFLDIFGFYTGDNVYLSFSQYALLGALTFSVLAMFFGIVDILKIDTKSKAWDIAAKHGGINFIIFFLFLILFIFRLKEHESVILHFSLSIIANTSLIFSNYLGGELVFKYDIGRKIR